MKKTNFILVVLLSFFSMVSIAQKKAKANSIKKKYPESFTVAKTDFDKFFIEHTATPMQFSNNEFINKAIVEMNTKNGDMQFLRVKLTYFTKAYLLVQVNGNYSTQIFIMSDDKSVFYKAKQDKEMVTFKKCKEDEIVSE